jgi:hypothetical protein
VHWRDYTICIPGLILTAVLILEKHLPDALVGYWIVLVLFFCFWQFVYCVYALVSAPSMAGEKPGRRRRYAMGLAAATVPILLALFRAFQAKRP